MAAQPHDDYHKEVQLQVINGPEPEAAPSREQPQHPKPKTKQIKWWLKVLTYVAFILIGQTAAVLLTRLYFVKGGSSKWLATTVQLAGFPLLIPYYLYHHRHHLITTTTATTNNNPNNNQPSNATFGGFYVLVGILVGGSTYLYSTGVAYLPVSTATLIASSQLAFNAFFSYFLNAQKFTALIVNSLFLLTISSVLLIFSGDPTTDPTGRVSSAQYTIGFFCTLASAATSGLFFSVSEYAFRKVLKAQSLQIVMNMLLFMGMVASGIGFIGLFASGDWKGLGKEMEGYELGKASYVMTLVGSGLSWEVFAIGTMALVFEVSSVFSNAVGTVGLPLAPILAVVVFGDRMSGVKAIAMVLAVWGFVSYLYQQYLDDGGREMRSGTVDVDGSNEGRRD